MQYIVSAVIIIVAGILIFFAGRYSVGGNGDNSDNTESAQTTNKTIVEKNDPPETPVVKQTQPVIHKVRKITIERKEDNDRINYIVFDNGNKTIVNNEEELEQILNDSLSNLAEKVEVKCDGNDDYRIKIEDFLKTHNKYNN